MSAVRAGDIIAGKFQIERVLGEGGMGYVVAARHLQLGQTVALKFMRDDVVTGEYRSRFLREARNTVRLKSKHVSRVLDVGALDGGTPYMVMEYLEGTDLSALLRERGRITAAEACEYIIQACEAIAEAHAHNIVHRDLKPANLFLTRGTRGEPIIKVLDFGVSKVLELGMDDETSRGGRYRNDSVVTKATDLLGSPSYMAPEQIMSARDADAGSDVWSLGVILFRLISGKPPFTGIALGELIQNIVHGPIPNLREHRPDLPQGLEHVVLRCLERVRERRPDAVELARLLAPYAGPVASPSLERVAILGPALVQGAPQRPPSGPSVGGELGHRKSPRGRSHRATKTKEMSTASLLLWALLFVAAIALIVVAAAKVFGGRLLGLTSAAPETTTVTSPETAEPETAEAPEAASTTVAAAPSASATAESGAEPIASPPDPADTARSAPTAKPPRGAPPRSPRNSDIPSSRE